MLIDIYLYLLELRRSIFKSSIYLDNNATTKPCKAAIKAYNENIFLGNASSLYANENRKIIEKTKAKIIECTGLSSNEYSIIFTSCASESINIFFNTLYEHNNNYNVVTTTYEHPTTMICLEKFKNIQYLSPDVNGLINAGHIINKQPLIVNIMQTNNEIGSTNFINLSQLPLGSIYHVDIVQSLSKYPLPHAHAYSISLHKLQGFTSSGILIIHNSLLPIFHKHPQIAGHQNDKLRGGTENTALIASIYGALTETFHNRLNKNILLLDKKMYILNILSDKFMFSPYSKYYNLPDDIIGDIYPLELVLISPLTSINTIFLSIVPAGYRTFDNFQFQKKLLKKGIIISLGSVCNKTKESHVLRAIKAPRIIRNGVIRISLGDGNTYNDCYMFTEEFTKLLINMLKL